MKKSNHKEWHLDEIVKTEILIPVVDTSVTSSLYQNAPEFKPYYSGDNPDVAKKSLMDIKQMSKDLANEITSKKQYLETFKNFPAKVEKVEPKKED
nr:MAG: hypothetical protein [Microvirus sp.]